ncbi:hypothetical protein GS498_04230 [Rhodococcus hoagii]|nr:hypothetical protein [Prescottella equi]
MTTGSSAPTPTSTPARPPDTGTRASNRGLGVGEHVRAATGGRHDVTCPPAA